jgi:hypothetical protein
VVVIGEGKLSDYAIWKTGRPLRPAIEQPTATHSRISVKARTDALTKASDTESGALRRQITGHPGAPGNVVNLALRAAPEKRCFDVRRFQADFAIGEQRVSETPETRFSVLSEADAVSGKRFEFLI